MKTVFVRQYVAVFTSTADVTPDLAIVPFKHMTYAEFSTFFHCRAKNLVGMDVVIEHFSTKLTASVPFPAPGAPINRKYEHWRWYRKLDGKQNVWKCITEGRFYRKFIDLDGEFCLKDEVKD